MKDNFHGRGSMVHKAIAALVLVGVGVIFGLVLRSEGPASKLAAQVPPGFSPEPPIGFPAEPPIGFPAEPPIGFLGEPPGGFAPDSRIGGVLPPTSPIAAPVAVPMAQTPLGIDMGDGFFAMTPEEAVNVSVYDRANRSVVNISTTSVRPESLLLATQIEGSGSGSVFDLQGHVLTNHHVISGSQKVTVTLFNGDAYPAKLVGHDADNDIAVLQIGAPESALFPVPWGDSSNLRVGQHVVAIGNPFGLERTMTTGIISSLNRQIMSKTKSQIHSIIQIDAALNQGNSGGPLFNSRAELIGMNTAIATRSGDNAGIGFAIPVNTIKRVVSQIITHGRVILPTIGILQVFETDRGLLVVNLTPGGPAEQAGIVGSKVSRRKGRIGLLAVEQDVVDHSQSDLIVGIDAKPVKRSEDLLGVIETKKPGDQVILTIVRNNRTHQVPITLGGNESQP